ncbi:hypothetical protein ZHAS_00002032 [Anopheles sinensis]|uniref:Uncharacterized protein n=1 Tax=Anopheles sinensis TaxID=74873 RepID=A0A084VBQ8_ANOSI|nr:hypothetical protein ZHAS_00002032 [Anopheles sinensis]
MGSYPTLGLSWHTPQTKNFACGPQQDSVGVENSRFNLAGDPIPVPFGIGCSGGPQNICIVRNRMFSLRFHQKLTVTALQQQTYAALQQPEQTFYGAAILKEKAFH